MRDSIHAKCGASRKRDGRWLVCGRSSGHSVLACLDPDGDQQFVAPERVGYPKLQGLGVRKLRPIASQLSDALGSLRQFLDPENPNCSVPADVREAAAGFLGTHVELPLSEALGAIDPRFRATEKEG